MLNSKPPSHPSALSDTVSFSNAESEVKESELRDLGNKPSPFGGVMVSTSCKALRGNLLDGSSILPTSSILQLSPCKLHLPPPRAHVKSDVVRTYDRNSMKINLENLENYVTMGA